ncbi:hypothetical protein ABZT45_30325 [Streptomyces sp. NPDC005356]|uniref:hypothetical protein n=1 Tax=unclassified Streptomyces TaxID=2593676 RepID=UPI0033AF9A9F
MPRSTTRMSYPMCAPSRSWLAAETGCARVVLDHAFRALGETLAPWIDRFKATALVGGGSIAASWDLIEVPLRIGLAEGPDTSSARRLAVRTALRP